MYVVKFVDVDNICYFLSFFSINIDIFLIRPKRSRYGTTDEIFNKVRSKISKSIK